MQLETPIPWLHIAGVLAEEARRAGYRRVGVLGTRFTMDGPVYRDTLAAMDIETVVPEDDDFDTVDRIIFSELVDGIFTDASRHDYNRVIARSASAGATRSLGVHGDPVTGASGGVGPAHARLHPAARRGRAAPSEWPDFRRPSAGHFRGHSPT